VAAALGDFADQLRLGLGPLSVLAVVAIGDRMEVLDHQGYPIDLSWRGSLDRPRLLKERALANLDVAKASPSHPPTIEPTAFQVLASRRTELGPVIDATRSRSRLAP
jgi:hypothetical protein